MGAALQHMSMSAFFFNWCLDDASLRGSSSVNSLLPHVLTSYLFNSLPFGYYRLTQFILRRMTARAGGTLANFDKNVLVATFVQYSQEQM